MPEAPATQQTAAPARSRPPGEMGGHTVMPWEQGDAESGQAATQVPAGKDPTTTASGGSSKSVPPPSEGDGTDGLGQGSGSTTVKAADGMMPPASQGITGVTPKPVAAKPPPGGAGANAPLEQAHPEGAEAHHVPTAAQVAKASAPAAQKGPPAFDALMPPGGARQAVPATKAPGSTPAVPGPPPAQRPASVAPVHAPLEATVRPSAGTASSPKSTHALVEALATELRTLLEKALQDAVAQVLAKPVPAPAAGNPPGAPPPGKPT